MERSREYHTAGCSEGARRWIVKFGYAAREAGIILSSGNQHFPVQ